MAAAQETLSVTEALARIRAAVAPLPAHGKLTAGGVGQVLAADVVARMDNPSFDNSAMDGVAVRAADLEEATEAAPVRLPVAGRIAAGAAPGAVLAPGQAVEIMTGAPLPDGADAIVPFEETEIADGHVTLRAAAAPDQFIRRRGSDLAEGRLLLSAGMRLTAQHLLPLSAQGVAQVSVINRPRVALIATGDEIVTDLGQALRPGQVYDSSGAHMMAALPAHGAVAQYAGSVGDDVDAFQARLDEVLAAGADVVVSTGAVSAGRFDFVATALEARGAEILFHSVWLRPGKPNLFARLPDGQLYFGLPGNPSSAAAGLRVFVGEALRALQGLPTEMPRRGVLTNGFKKRPPFTHYLKGALDQSDGRCRVTILPGQESYRLAPMLTQDVWVVLPGEVEIVAPGDQVAWLPLLPS